jgi:hypothetical protein
MNRSITLYCSELAALVGCNRFVKKTDAWDKVFQRSFHFKETANQTNLDLGKKITQDLMESATITSSSSSSSFSSFISKPEENVEKVKIYTENLVKIIQQENLKSLETIEKVRMENSEKLENLDLDKIKTISNENKEKVIQVSNVIQEEKERILSVVEEKFTELKPETRKELVNNFFTNQATITIETEKNETEKKEKERLIQEGAVSHVKTRYGVEKESTGLDKFGEVFSSSHIQTNIKPKVMKINKNFLLYGVVDAMMDDDIVIEHKARTKRLFYDDFHTEIYTYEYIQVQSYLFLYNKEQAYLVETHQDDLNYRTIFYDFDFLNTQAFSKLVFKDNVTVDTIREYYFEKDSKAKLKKLSNLFVSC